MTTPTPIIEALEPCPMCGDQPIRNGRGNVGGLICTGIGSDPRYAHRVQAYGSTQAEAEAAWNTRAPFKSPHIDLDHNGGASGETFTVPNDDDGFVSPSVTIGGNVYIEQRNGDGGNAPMVVLSRPQALALGRDLVAALTPPEPACSSGEGLFDIDPSGWGDGSFQPNARHEKP